MAERCVHGPVAAMAEEQQIHKCQVHHHTYQNTKATPTAHKRYLRRVSEHHFRRPLQLHYTWPTQGTTVSICHTKEMRYPLYRR